MTVPFWTSSSTPASNPWTYRTQDQNQALFLITTNGPHGLRSGWQISIESYPGGILAPAINFASMNGAQTGFTALSASLPAYSGTATLAAAITTLTQTTVTLTGGAWVVNGDVLYLGGELMLVDSGGGTTSLTVTRGYQGTTAGDTTTNSAAYSSGATVYPASQLSVAADSPFLAVGDTIQVDSGSATEQMVVATSGVSSKTPWVGRAINGTAASAHSSGAQVYTAFWPTVSTGAPRVAWVVNPTQFLLALQNGNYPNLAMPILAEVTIPSPSNSYAVTWNRPPSGGNCPIAMGTTLAAQVAAGNDSGECLLWISVPLLCTDDGIAGLLNSQVIPYLTPGVSMVIQLSNEIWNFDFLQYSLAAVMSATTPNPTATGPAQFAGIDDYVAYRQDHITQVAQSTFQAAGLNPNRVFFLQASQATSGDAKSILQSCQANQYRVDYHAFAPYFSIPASAAVAGIFLDWLATDMGGTAPWSNPALTRQVIMGYMRAMYFYSAQISANVLGIGECLSQYNNGIAVGSSNGATGHTNPAAVAGSPGRMCFYEYNALTISLPDGVSQWYNSVTSAQTSALTRDISYDPRFYVNEQLYLQALQQQAYDWGQSMPYALVPNAKDLIPAFGCYLTTAYGPGSWYGRGEDNLYGIYISIGQKAGYGTGVGTVGPNQNTFVNAFGWTSTAAPKCLDYRNDSVRGQALADWNSSIPSATTPSSRVTRIAKRWFPGLRRPRARPLARS